MTMQLLLFLFKQIVPSSVELWNSSVEHRPGHLKGYILKTLLFQIVVIKIVFTKGKSSPNSVVNLPNQT